MEKIKEIEKIEKTKENECKNNTLNIVTWNVNGIRSRIFNDKLSTKLKKGQSYIAEINSPISNLIQETQADIICLQETRCDNNNGKLALLEGYNSYFNSSKLTDARGPNRYSGTAIYTKICPNKIEYSVPEYDDQEGRMMIVYFNNFIVINVYSPNSGTNYENKIKFQDALLSFTKTITIPIIYCGDFNIAIDTHFDKSKVLPGPGLYNHELLYHTQLEKEGLIDSKSNEDKIIYTWWDQRGKKIIDPITNKEMNSIRLANRGWRLDYIFTRGFKSAESKVLKHIGEENSPHASDHAPVHAKILI
jgi:exodeoxyribonuclease-3